MTTQSDRLATALAGRYRIERELGAGGMAMVYLAHDERHSRNVALKVLRPELAAVIGAERFLNEIKTTANLQHPHILPLHDSGEIDGTVWYVMPVVEGESLRDRLNRETQLPIDDALTIAREVASALDYAHRHGVVHRDIKPENILLHDGRAVVADFGIALAVSKTEGSTRLTETGMSLGTPFYMSPEQALGERTVDARTDVYALGAVTYEMLVGEPPFTGPSAQAVLAKVMSAPAPSAATLRPTIPIGVDAAIARALAKLPADRFRSAADFASALQAGAGTSATSAHTSSALPVATPRARVVSAAPWALAAAAVAVAMWFATRGDAGANAAGIAAVVPLEIRTARDAPLNEIGVPFSLSRDGSFIVYVGADPEVKGTTALWKRSLDRLEVTPIPGTRGAQAPRISGDGKRVFYMIRAPSGNGNEYRVIDIAGGIAQQVAIPHQGARPLDDGSAMGFGRGEVRRYRTLEEFRADTGAGRLVGARMAFSLSPDSQVIATAAPGTLRDSIRIGPVDGARSFLTLGMSPRFLDKRTLAYRGSDGSLMVGRLNGDRTEFATAPIAIVPGVATAGNEHAQYDVSSDGTLIYVAGAGAAAARLTWVDAAGNESKVPGAESRVYGGVSLAPDGRRAVTTVGALTQSGDIWLEDMVSGARTPLTTNGQSTRGSWSPDGDWITYVRPDITSRGVAPGGRIYQQQLGSDAPPDTVTRNLPPALATAEFQWGPDRRSAAMRLSRLTGGGRDIFVLEPGASKAIEYAADSGVQERGPRISPDGKWLAYISDVSGRDEVYVDAFPKPRSRVPISLDGGREVTWSREGSKLFYRAPDGWMMSATVTRGTTVTVTKRDRLFDATPYLANQFLNMYDVGPGDRFLMVRLDSESPRTDIVIIRNWAQQVMARLNGGGQ